MEMGEQEIQSFLTHLAVQKNYAASTQNQALNAIVFLYKQVLKKDLGDFSSHMRAKKSTYVPTVLSEKEVSHFLSFVEPGVFRLMIKIIYGCGLRLRELYNLRIHDIDFDNKKIIIRDPKGNRGRAVMLPQSCEYELQEQIIQAKRKYMTDRNENVPGVALPFALEQKYPNANKEFAWFWLFPALSYSQDPRTGIVRRHHMHESNLQREIKKYRIESGIQKHIKPHTFRHSFATHLLMNGTDINTVQKLLGHKNIETTMIYLHVLEMSSFKVQSPLDKITNQTNREESAVKPPEIDLEREIEETVSCFKDVLEREKEYNLKKKSANQQKFHAHKSYRQKESPSGYKEPLKEKIIVGTLSGTEGNLRNYENESELYTLPYSVVNVINDYTQKHNITPSLRKKYHSWSRFYFHFCRKYSLEIFSYDSLELYKNKLIDRGKTSDDIAEAETIITVLFHYENSVIPQYTTLQNST